MFRHGHTRDNPLQVGVYQWPPEVWHSPLALPLRLKRSDDSIHVWMHRERPMLWRVGPIRVPTIAPNLRAVIPAVELQYSQVAVGMILQRD